MLSETWYCDDEASLLRNVNNNKYDLVFHFNFSLGFVSHGFVVIYIWICQNLNEIHEHDYRRNSALRFLMIHKMLRICPNIAIARKVLLALCTRITKHKRIFLHQKSSVVF